MDIVVGTIMGLILMLLLLTLFLQRSEIRYLRNENGRLKISQARLETRVNRLRKKKQYSRWTYF